MIHSVFKYFLVITFISGTTFINAQHPVLPPANLGSANVFDGFAGKPGFVYQDFVQAFKTRAAYDQYGAKDQSDLHINSMVQINQLIHLSKLKIFNGNLAFTVLVPVVQLNVSGSGDHIPNVNPGILGDIIYGTAIQWSDKKLFEKPFSHRAEFDINLPVGSYSSDYAVNPSSHLWSYSIYHAFTLMLTEKMSVSSRNQLNLNSHILGSSVKPGAFYNGNYSVDYEVCQK